MIGLITFMLPIDCSSGHGCPDWAWREYLEYKEAHPEEYAEKWVNVDDEYPTDEKWKLCLTEKGIVQARWVSRIFCWITIDEEVLSYYLISHWRTCPLFPHEEVYIENWE